MSTECDNSLIEAATSWRRSGKRVSWLVLWKLYFLDPTRAVEPFKTCQKPKIHNILPVYFSQTAECRFIQKMLSDNFVKVQQLSRQQKCLQCLEYFTGLSINLLCKTLAYWKISRTSGLGASFKINKWLCRHQRNQVTLTDRRNTLVYRASVKVKQGSRLPLLVSQECNDNKFSKKHFQQRMKTSRSQRQYRTFALWPSDKPQGL